MISSPLKHLVVNTSCPVRQNDGGAGFQELVASPERCCGLPWPQGSSGKLRSSEWVVAVCIYSEGLCPLLLKS